MLFDEGQTQSKGNFLPPRRQVRQERQKIIG
jgi:hypothetical protein